MVDVNFRERERNRGKEEEREKGREEEREERELFEH